MHEVGAGKKEGTELTLEAKPVPETVPASVSSDIPNVLRPSRVDNFRLEARSVMTTAMLHVGPIIAVTIM